MARIKTTPVPSEKKSYRRHETFGGKPSESYKKKRIEEPKSVVSSIKKSRRKRPGVGILREIKKAQSGKLKMIPKAPFERLIRELIVDLVPEGYRVKKSALEALKEAAEDHATKFLSNANIAAAHADRVTIYPSDLEIAKNMVTDGNASLVRLSRKAMEMFHERMAINALKRSKKTPEQSRRESERRKERRERKKSETKEKEQNEENKMEEGEKDKEGDISRESTPKPNQGEEETIDE